MILRVGVLFMFTIDPNTTITPSTSFEGLSYYEGEAEILFSMHSVFRVGTIQQMDREDELYQQVQLRLTADDDPKFRVLTGRIKCDVKNSTG
ncbi:unnamed protein product [Adineta ricciae]|uniref:Uncharacterized protein n=1 Tax=Adineta ricciae TaxID=249248 RepID=A0A814WYN8_ADIRI|nr:unnamed protein product [Adineta ricciae]